MSKTTDCALTATNIDSRVIPEQQQKTMWERYRIVLTWSCFVLMIGFSVTNRSHWEPGDLMSTLLLFTGLSLAFIGCIGRVWCSLFIDGFKTSVLVTVGPYAMCRNPLYFFSAVGGVGVAFGSGTVTLPVLVVILFATYYTPVIRSEERRLLQIHGDLFVQYCESVPAFFPRQQSRPLPSTYTIHPRMVWSGILESTWFIWVTMLLHWFFELQHRSQILPISVECY